MPSVDLDAPEHAICSRVMEGYRDQINMARVRAERAEAEAERLRRLVEDAVCHADEGWSYASDYFREKWQCEARSSELRALVQPSSSVPLKEKA